MNAKVKALAGSALLVLAVGLSVPTRGQASPRTSPIQHVVVIYQENHSFNELLGKLCLDENDRCTATATGTISDGSHIPLSPESNLVPTAGHEPDSQEIAMDGGKMDGWDKMLFCGPQTNYECLTQAQPGSVPDLWSLADSYTISDRTFETVDSSSWGSHLELASANPDGFLGYEPQSIKHAKGDGCDSKQDTKWQGTTGSDVLMVPSCVPDKQGNGPYRSSPVQYVPTIMDSMDAAGLSWRIYAPGPKGGSGYGWAICPTFYECLGSKQAKNVVSSGKLATDAARGKLPNLSILIPYPQNSQHNGFSLIEGDNWVAQNVQAIMDSPDWSSTAIFITYDDCGCFYDPVPPPAGRGIRVPMVIVSPYAKAHFVDHTDAALVSILAFTEHTFGLPPLAGGLDGGAYDYANAFDYLQRPLAPIPLPQHRVPPWVLARIAQHPPDPNDPT